MAPARCPDCNLFLSTTTTHHCPNRPSLDWICPGCGLTYTSPIPLTGAGHRCPSALRWKGFTRDERAERRREDPESEA